MLNSQKRKCAYSKLRSLCVGYVVQHGGIDGILGSLVGSQGTKEEDVVLRNLLVVHDSVKDFEFVLGQGTSLVTTQDVHASQLFDGSEVLDDTLVLSKLTCTDRHSNGQHNGHRNRNTTDDQHQDVVDGRTLVNGETDATEVSVRLCCATYASRPANCTINSAITIPVMIVIQK